MKTCLKWCHIKCRDGYKYSQIEYKCVGSDRPETYGKRDMCNVR